MGDVPTVGRLLSQTVQTDPLRRVWSGLRLRVVQGFAGALVLLTGYATPDKLRRIGEARLTGWLKHRRVPDAAGLAERAVAAANQQHIRLSGQDVAAELVESATR